MPRMTVDAASISSPSKFPKDRFLTQIISAYFASALIAAKIYIMMKKNMDQSYSLHCSLPIHVSTLCIKASEHEFLRNVWDQS
eukprot:558223-Ditylum_brightwellii.AAC.1